MNIILLFIIAQPPPPLNHMKSLPPPPRLSFSDRKRHLFDAFVVVGTFPGLEAGPPPCRLAAAADGREKKKKEEDKGGGRGTSGRQFEEERRYGFCWGGIRGVSLAPRQPMRVASGLQGGRKQRRIRLRQGRRRGKEATQRTRKRQGEGRVSGGEGALPSEDGGVLLDGRLAPPPIAIMTINKGHRVNGRPARRSAAPASATTMAAVATSIVARCSWVPPDCPCRPAASCTAVTPPP
jgi:hypothetical protein